MSFSSEIDSFVKSFQGAVSSVVADSIKEISEKIILRTPVDTGRARANWQAMINDEANSSINWQGNDSEGNPDLSAPAPSEGSDFAIANMIPVAEQAVGEVFVMTNSVIYTEDLEYGTSAQAPQGMLRRTVSEWEGIVRENANTRKI
jgi:hypothetical protein